MQKLNFTDTSISLKQDSKRGSNADTIMRCFFEIQFRLKANKGLNTDEKYFIIIAILIINSMFFSRQHVYLA